MNALPTKDSEPSTMGVQPRPASKGATASPTGTHIADSPADFAGSGEGTSEAASEKIAETIQHSLGEILPGVVPPAKKFLNAIQIHVLSGPHAGESRVIGAGHQLVVGRCPPADWQLPNETKLSRRHFQINVHPDHGRVIDLGSTNGTVLNGEKVAELDVQNGDRIQCGPTVFAFQLMFSSKEPDTGSTVEF